MGVIDGALQCLTERDMWRPQQSVWLLLDLALMGSTARRCFECDGIKQGGGLCQGDGLGKIGRQVECYSQYCGLLKEQRLTSKRGSVVSTDTRWRRGCTTDGSEIIANSEAESEELSYGGILGCQDLQSYTYDTITVRFTLCLCNSTICNTTPQDMGGTSSCLSPPTSLIAVLVLSWISS